jgi:hypothetical protein
MMASKLSAEEVHRLLGQVMAELMDCGVSEPIIRFLSNPNNKMSDQFYESFLEARGKKNGAP